MLAVIQVYVMMVQANMMLMTVIHQDDDDDGGDVDGVCYLSWWSSERLSIISQKWHCGEVWRNIFRNPVGIM